MSTGTLFISFWHLPGQSAGGTFRCRRISSDESSRYIQQFRLENKLLCVSQVDLAALTKSGEAENHEALCRVLADHFGIPLSPEDFFSRHDDEEGEALYFANALSCVQIRDDRRLLVVTCNYAVAKEKTASRFPAFDIDPCTVEFHLIEAV